MEQEELYQSAQSKISDLTAALDSLNQFSFAKALSDVKEDIENHFDILIKTLQKRKGDFISSVDKLYQELQKQIDVEKEEVTEKIRATNKFVECGALLYNLQRETALEMWERSCKIMHIKSQKKRVQVDLPSLAESISSHGTAFIEKMPSTVRTLAGSTQGKQIGEGVNAKFNSPYGIVLNPLDDCLYVCDPGNYMIHKITRSGSVSKFVDMSAIGISFYQKEQCYFVTNFGNHVINRISLDGKVSTYAGSGSRGYQDGERMNAMFYHPYGIAVNQDTGDVYVSDNNHIIRKITPQGQVSTLAGTPEKSGHSDGIQSTRFSHPQGICFHSQQQALIVCDIGNSKLRKILLDGTVSTICTVESPLWASVLSDGSILVSSRSKIVKVSFSGNKIESEVFAGTKKEGDKDGTLLESEFKRPYGIAIDIKTDDCFIADHGNYRIRAISCE